MRRSDFDASIIPAQPGWFVIVGEWDCSSNKVVSIFREPIIAWRIESDGSKSPVPIVVDDVANLNTPVLDILQRPDGTMFVIGRHEIINDEAAMIWLEEQSKKTLSKEREMVSENAAIDRTLHRDGFLALFPAVAVRDSRLSPRELSVLIAYGSYIDDGGWCSLSQTRLGEMLGMSGPVISKIQRRLVELGYLKTCPQTRANGGSGAYLTRVLYEVQPPEENLRAPPAGQHGRDTVH